MDRLIGQIGPAAELPAPGDSRGSAIDRFSVASPGAACAASAAAGRLVGLRRDAAWQVCVGGVQAIPSSDGGPDGATAMVARLAPGREAPLQMLTGDFAVAAFDPADKSLLVATDRFGTLPVYYATIREGLVFGTDLGWVGSRAGGPARLNHQALYDYLFFSVVPGDKSILRGVHKLPPASVLRWRDGRAVIARYWQPDFHREPADTATLEARTRDAISAAVASLCNLPDRGCFLSGGLDSSTVCGMAARHSNDRAAAFTIGFDHPRYDERHYARVTARHFHLDLRETTLRSADVVPRMERVVAAFPEPFGNPSALPAYVCAETARDSGVRHLLAGDGGDELFAGNERYQEQLLFELYGRLPSLLRRGMIDPLASIAAGAPSPLRKLHGYVRQARVGLPDRLFTYNLLVRMGPRAVLTEDFLREIDTESPYRYARSVYDDPPTGDVVDRMMYLDWAITLADNDLRKVRVTSELAGVSVHFPMLDAEVVRVSTLVPTGAKLTLRELRRFYKNAFRDFLPGEVIGKRKHGFGVPVGIWLREDRDLRELVRARLDALGRRGIVVPSLIGELLGLIDRDHAPYYGSLIWPLYALEAWLQSRGF